MRVAMYYNNNDIRIEEMPEPQISSRELLVRVHASGICGSDVMEWYRIKTAPRVLGHEIAGEIVKAGKDVEAWKVGDRVFVSHHVPCNKCHYCKSGHHTVCETLRRTNFFPGGFSELIRVPEINVKNGVYKLPEQVSYEEGVFIEPLACVVRGQRIANVQPQQSILVLGSGITGLLHIHLASLKGVNFIVSTDVNEFRLKAAQHFGANAAIHAAEDVSSRFRDLNKGRLADVVMVCTGAKAAIEQALSSVDRGGTILFFAPAKPGYKVPLPLAKFWKDEITVTTSYGGSPADIMEAIELIKSRKMRVREMITHRLSLEETGLGFKLVSSPKKSIKVVIEPQR